MPPVERLPPPPAVPKRSPPVAIRGEESERIAGRAGGPALDARVHVPSAAVRSVVICHPHPLYGGSMHSPVCLALARALSEHASDRVAWARFDFRGVGASEGHYDEGRGELDDAMAVIEALARRVPRVPVTVSGHSFGSWIALRAAASAPRELLVTRAVLFAPSTRIFALSEGEIGFLGTTSIFVGSEDEYCGVDEARELGRRLHADRVRVFEGFDHQFMQGRRRVAEEALSSLVPEVDS
jgi:hypothetical protein